MRFKQKFFANLFDAEYLIQDWGRFSLYNSISLTLSRPLGKLTSISLFYLFKNDQKSFENKSGLADHNFNLKLRIN